MVFQFVAEGSELRLGLVDVFEIFEVGVVTENLASSSRLGRSDEDGMARLERKASKRVHGWRSVAARGNAIFVQKVDDHRGLDLVGNLAKTYLVQLCIRSHRRSLLRIPAFVST